MNVTNRHILLGGALILASIVVGALLMPSLVYDQFIWKYFWGPIVADAGSGTAVHNGVVAEQGYTLVNEIGYGLLLSYLLLALVTLLKKFNIGHERHLAIYFFPVAVSGGMMRVLEDMPALTGVIDYPIRYLLITPIIYFVMFLIVAGLIGVGLLLQRRSSYPYYYTVAAGGTVLVAALTTVLLWYGTTVDAWMFPATAGAAGLILAAVFGVGKMLGLTQIVANVFPVEKTTVLYGHMLDASSTALSIAFLGYGEKHPVVDAAITWTGSSFTFIPLKLAVIGSVLYLLDSEFREDDPVLYNWLMIGILAIGTGPGIRNMVRAIFGV